MLTDLLPSLGDPLRARLLVALEAHELSVRELQEILQLPQSTASRHLRVLAEQKWVDVRPDGASQRYRFTPPPDGSPRERLWKLIRDETVAGKAAQSDARRIKAVLAQRQTRSRRFFATEAGRWDRLREELFGQRFELGLLLGLVDPAWTVGDLGCGTGALSSALAPFVRRVIAVDESEPMLAGARSRLEQFANVEVRQGELVLLPLGEDDLDVAALVLVFPYVPDPGRVLGEAARAVRPGGRILVMDLQPHDRTDWEHTMGHLWQGFGPGQMLGWMSGAGLRESRYVALPPDPESKGPGLFVATGVKASLDAARI
jgi:ArsR family transcriptional regulator